MLTVANRATVELTVKRSRFLARARRVDCLADTLKFHEFAAEASATHNCWAWKLDETYRFGDDGEPSGTAGRPILASIEHRRIDHVMVIVSRWYGGVKLGVGGLIRAYGGAAAKCLELAGTLDVAVTDEYAIDADFSWTGQIHAAMEACGATKLSESYGENGLSIHLSIERDRATRLNALLRDATRGAVGLKPL